MRDARTAAAILGRIGRQRNTERQAEASRENGKRGGRPPSTKKKNHMKRLSVLVAALSLASLGVIGCGPTVLYAQTLPATLTVTWTPNAASDSVTGYEIQLDQRQADVVSATPAASGLIESVIVVPTYGAHTVQVVAKSTSLSCPGSPDACSSGVTQSSAPSTITFVLSPPPSAASGVKVSKK
jgi:hypothetical protein